MKKYKTEFKLKVVQSFLAGEGGAKLLARRWLVPEEKVRTWVIVHSDQDWHYKITLPSNACATRSRAKHEPQGQLL